MFVAGTVRTECGERGYLYSPPDPKHWHVRSPVIVFLHGRGECGTDGLRQGTVGLVPAALALDAWDQFLIIAPQKPGPDDTWEQHEQYVLDCVEWFTDNNSDIDPSRIYLTGLSQGGAGTWAIGAKHPELFAAIAPVCGFVHDPAGSEGRYGTESRESEIAAALAAANMPVWAFHGEKDDIIPPDHTRSMIQAIHDARSVGAHVATSEDVKATYFPSANHNSWDAAYRDNGEALAAWFRSYRRNADGTIEPTTKPR